MKTVRLLLLDDHPLEQKLFGRYLRAHGFDVEAAGSVAEADAVLSERPVDLVLGEVFSRRGDVLALVQRLKARGGPAFVAVSSHVLPERRTEALAAGCAEFLPKPIELRGLVTVLRRHLAYEAAR